MNPCKCEENAINCGGLEFIDLKEIFLKLNAKLNDKHFEKFVLNNGAITELTENTFGNITFDIIYIDHALNLTRIETKTFSNMESNITVFIVNKTPIESSVPNYDLFTAFSSMNNLKKLDIEYTNLKDIPNNAFRPLNGVQKNLISVNLPSNNISTIGENAFQSLPNIQTIDLSSNLLKNISENVFKITNTSEKLLQIYLTSNELNSNSFAQKSFDNLKRPTLLTLSYNNITYLDENVFHSFLNKDINNTIVLSTLDCNDCHSFWLIKNQKLKEQMNQVFCSDDSSIYNKNKFQKCL